MAQVLAATLALTALCADPEAAADLAAKTDVVQVSVSLLESYDFDLEVRGHLATAATCVGPGASCLLTLTSPHCVHACRCCLWL